MSSPTGGGTRRVRERQARAALRRRRARRGHRQHVRRLSARAGRPRRPLPARRWALEAPGHSLARRVGRGPPPRGRVPLGGEERVAARAPPLEGPRRRVRRRLERARACPHRRVPEARGRRVPPHRHERLGRGRARSAHPVAVRRRWQRQHQGIPRRRVACVAPAEDNHAVYQRRMKNYWNHWKGAMPGTSCFPCRAGTLSDRAVADPCGDDCIAGSPCLEFAGSDIQRCEWLPRGASPRDGSDTRSAEQHRCAPHPPSRHVPHSHGSW